MQTSPEARDRDPRLIVLLSVFAELEKSGANYALIHGTVDDWPDVTSDVDLAFAEPPPQVIEPVLRRLASTGHFSIVQRLHYEIPHGYYYILRTPGIPTRFLHLDCLHDPLGVNRYHFSTSVLLEGATDGPFARRIGKETEALYLLMKRAVKGKVSAQGLEILRDQLSKSADTFWEQLHRWFGPEGRRHADHLLSAGSPSEASPHFAKLRAGADRMFRSRHPLRYCRAYLMGARRKLRRLVQPTGLFVVIIGPDGSGKSTVTGLVLSRLERAFRKTWRFHWRPNLLPKLRRRTAEPGGREGAPPSPAEASKYRGIVSLSRFAYYWLDFVLGYWLIIYPRRAQTTLVVGERYFPDVVVHPERYGFAVPKWMMRMAARWVPSPDLLVLLEDDPEVIYARKPELTIAQISSQIRAYEREAKYWGGASVVVTQGGAESVAARVADLILDECAQRTQARLQRCDPTIRWRGFPSRRNAKVWCSDNDTLVNSLGLYHPYSRRGHAAKFVVGLLPAALCRWLFPMRPDELAATRLRLYTQLICQSFGDQRLAISFATGTPGPHRKLTAQVTREGTVVGYVKIGENKSVSQLLQREAEMLAWLENEKPHHASWPRVLGYEQHEENTLLILSSPARPGKRRPLQADASDAQFLSALGSLRAGTVPLAMAFDQMGFDAFLDQMRLMEPATADLLRSAIKTIGCVLGERGARVTSCHGDYAPWNTLELEDGAHYVFDWEYGRQQAPALNDLFHRVTMPARLVLRQRPDEVMNRLLDLPSDPVLSPVISQSAVPTADLPAYILLYLLGQFRESDEDTPDAFLIESIRHIVAMVRHGAGPRNVLVSAYACEPGRGSEPGVGWQMCLAISREHDAWVITRRNNRDKIEAALARHPNPRLHFHYADLPRWMSSWKKGGRGVRIYYYLWQFAALAKAVKLMRTVRFDIAHHVTFVSDFMFTFLALLPIRYVWGPIGSANKIPLYLADGVLQFLALRVQYWLKAFVRVADPLFWLSAMRSALVIGINDGVGRKFPLALLVRNKYLTHSAIGVEECFVVERAVSADSHNGLRILGVGRLVALKGFVLSMRAFAAFSRREPGASFTIIGDGPMRAKLETLARNLGVREKVSIIPWLPRAEGMQAMVKADVFLFPSMEAEGMVVLEAMAHGLPIVCLDKTGPGRMVPPDCGFVVSTAPTKMIAARLASALERLAREPALRTAMGSNARRVIRRHHVWEDRHKTIREWYLAAGIESPAPLVRHDAARRDRP